MSCGTALPADQPAPHGTRKTVTIIFCDLAGSTAIGERLDPEAVRDVMTAYYAAMRDALETHGGSVEKYIGDAVMGVFGVPVLHEDDALRAVEAAAAMRSSIAGLDAAIRDRYGVEIAVRIGVNTGVVVVGDPSGGQSLVVGDAVNVAARLEQVAASGEVLLGPQTYALVRQHVDAERTEPLALKGKSAEIVAYRLRAVAPTRDAVGLRPDPPFVGRAAEMGTLMDAFSRARSGRSCVLLTVIGSAGVGKSRLAREFVASVADDAQVIVGRCLPYGDGITFWPVVELVKDACGITDDEPRASARVKIDSTLVGAEDASLVAERVAAVAGLGDTVGGLQETFWSIRRFLEHLARERTVVVLIDDIHWAEPALLDLVEYLAGWTRDAPILLLCLARPDLLDVRPGWGGTHPDATTLALGPLDEQESEHLITQLLGAGLGPDVIDRIREAGGGNPLFLEELLRMLEDEGLLERRDGAWSASGDLAGLRVPGSIQALLGARLDRLTPEEAEVIRAAAVVGKEFWWGAVDELVEADLRPRVGAHLQTLVRKDLIRPERSSLVGEDAFRFHHILIQEAAYAGTSKDARARLHERFARWVEATARDRLAELEAVLGYHLERAYRYRTELGAPGPEERELAARAADWLARAGHRAAERRDANAASDLLGRAVSLLPADAPERPGMLLELVAELGEIGDLAASARALDEVDAIASATGDEVLAARAAIPRLVLLEATDPKRLGPAAIAVERAIQVLDAGGDDLWLARAWLTTSDLHMNRSRHADADAALERAIEHARRAGSPVEEADALGRYAGSGLYGPAPVEDVEPRCLDLLDRTGGGATEGPALRALAGVRAMQGRFDEARAHARRARGILEDFGLRLRARWVSETLGTIEMLAGNVEDAEREFRDGYDAADAFGDHGFQATMAALLAHALLDQGRAEEAERLAAISGSLAAEDDLASQVLWRGAHARATAAADPDRSRRLAREAVALALETDDVNMQADAFVDLGVVLGGTGDPDAARSAFDDAIARFEAKGNVAGAERVRSRSASVL